MIGMALSLATAATLLFQTAPGAQNGRDPVATSPRVWSRVFQVAPPVASLGESEPRVKVELGMGAADSYDARQRELQAECLMPVIQADPRVDPSMIVSQPPGEPVPTIRSVGRLPRCPRR